MLFFTFSSHDNNAGVNLLLLPGDPHRDLPRHPQAGEGQMETGEGQMEAGEGQMEGKFICPAPPPVVSPMMTAAQQPNRP